MKIVVFKARKNSKSDGKRIHLKNKSSGRIFEKFLFFSFVFLFSALILIQIAIMNQSAKTFFIKDSWMEGCPLKTEEYLYSRGEITLELCGQESDEALKILLNGDEIAVFSKSAVNLRVMDGDIYRLTEPYKEAEVKIAFASPNIKSCDLGKK